MGDRVSRFVRFTRELYRRRVPRVATAYVIAGWAVVTFSQDLSGILNLPVWAPNLILALLILGFPVTIGVSWAFDVTSHGMVRTPDEHDLSPRHVVRPAYGKYAGAVVLVVAALFLAGWNLWRLGSSGRNRSAPGGMVAVIPAVVQGDPQYESLAETVTTLVATKLESMGWRTANGVEASRAARRQNASDPAASSNVAQRVGAAFFVDVRVTFADGTAMVNLTLQSVNDPQIPIGVGEATGSFDDVVLLVDEASARLAGVPTPGARQRVAVFPASVGADPEQDYLRHGISRLLSEKLEKAGWDAVDPRTLFGIVEAQGMEVSDVSAAARIAGRVEAGFFIISDIRITDRPGRPGRFAVDGEIDLFDVDDPAEAVISSRIGGPLEDLLERLDEVAHDLLEVADLDWGEMASVADMPTRSLPALAAFIEGEREFRVGHYDLAIAAFERAVTEDTAFALAYYRLSIAAGWQSNSYNAWQQDGLRKALAHSERLTWRRRLLLEARRIKREKGETDNAEQLYRWIKTRWRQDYDAWFQLAELLFHDAPLEGRSAIESGTAWEWIMGIEPSDYGALVHWIRIKALEGDRNGVERIAELSRELAPDDEKALEMDAIRVFLLREPEMWKTVLDSLSTQSSHFVWNVASRVGIYDKALVGAERIAALLTDTARSGPYRALGHITLAHLLVGQGRWREARTHLEAVRPLDLLSAIVFEASLSTTPFLMPAVDSSDLQILRDALRAAVARQPTGESITETTVHDSIFEWLRLYELGNTSLALGAERDVQTIATELINQPGSSDAAEIADHFGRSLMAMLQRRRGASAAAAQEWDSFRVETGNDKKWLSPFFALSRERYLRALNLREVGREDEALILFSSFNEVSVYDLAYVAPAAFQSAEILEARGDVAAAVQEYSKVVRLWRNADPELQPMVERARTRILTMSPSLAQG